MQLKRRALLEGAVVGLAVPWLLPSRVWAQKPTKRLTMGFVGMGVQNRHLMGAFMGHEVQVVAVCDVDTTRREDAKRRVDERYGHTGAGGCKAVRDFREITERDDIDVVCVATPDHWHALVTLSAIRHGKDVYCEKPLTHNIHEAMEIIRAVEANKRVLQTGSQQRSSKEFRIACELVRNGVIGKIERVVCSFGGPPKPCDLPEEPMEPGLDWDMWLGPAPVRPYNSVLSPRGVHNHFPAWRDYLEYGGGGVADWGAHQLDIAQWGLDMDRSGPVEVIPPEKSGAGSGAKLLYANGVVVEHKGGFGVHFFGADGEVAVNSGRFQFIHKGKLIASFTGQKDTSCAAQVQIAEKQFLQDAKIRLYESRNHIGNFLECVQNRSRPVASEQEGGRTAICCHLMNLAYLHGQRMKWDPEKFCFVDGTGDPKWLSREYRSPWKV